MQPVIYLAIIAEMEARAGVGVLINGWGSTAATAQVIVGLLRWGQGRLSYPSFGTGGDDPDACVT